MRLIIDWLELASGVRKLLASELVQVEVGSVTYEAILKQLADLDRLIEEVRESGFFLEQNQVSYLVSVSTREHLDISNDLIEEVGYLYEIVQRSIRLGKDKAGNVLKIKGN